MVVKTILHVSSEGHFKIINITVTMLQFKCSDNMIMQKVVVALKEREMILQEQFQDVECRRTKIEDKSKMELDYLCQEKNA